MGVKLSKPGPGDVANMGAVKIQHQLINYLSRSFIRNLVSKKRRRMLVGGYDLDMTYITNRVLAMSFPAERIRAMYRNPMWQVKSVLDMRHKGHYKVFNLCIEQAYDPSHFHGRVERFPFDDNHVPSLPMIKEFCESLDSWVSSNPKNIVVVHCMAGKGRTGLMVSAYLVYTGMAAEDALQLFADRRTTDGQGDEWVISRLFKKTPSSGMTNMYSEMSSSSSISLPPLLDPTPYTAATTDNVINYSYLVNINIEKEHVSCFSRSTAAPSGFSYQTLFDGGLPPSLMVDSTSSSMSSSSQFQGNTSEVSEMTTTFPNLRSLEENLHLPSFFFPSMTPSPMHGGVGNIYASDTGNCSMLETQKPGLSELDCIWRGPFN